MNSHWILSDSKSPRVSRTLLNILADLNDAAVWMVSTHPFISQSFNPSTRSLVTIPSAPSHSRSIVFFSVYKQGLGTNLSFHFISVLPCGTTKSTIRQVLFPSYFTHFRVFRTSVSLVFHWILRDSKSLQVSRTLLSILADCVVVWMVSTRSLISKSYSPCTNPFETVPRAPITNRHFHVSQFLFSIP